MSSSIFGTDPKYLARTDDPDTSHEAAESVDTTMLEALVYSAVYAHPEGCIQDEVLAMYPHKPYSSITARFRALLDKKLIEDTGLRKKGRSGRNQRIVKVNKEQRLKGI